MPDDTPDLPVPVDGKTPWLRWPQKLRLLDLLESGLKAVGAGRKLAQGDWQGAIDDALAAYEGIGDLELAQRKAATLVSRALARAIGDLIDDHRHHLERMAEAPAPSPDDVMIELVLDADFFDHPESLVALGPLQIGLAGWLQEHGRRDEPNGVHHHPTRARTIAERLGAYYAAALAREYRRQPDAYEAIWAAIQSPVTRIEQRINDWRAYHARLMTLPDAPLFADTFSLRQIYQPLRAWWLDRGAADDGADDDAPRGRRAQGQRRVVDVTSTLHGWLDDPRPGDAIRVISGGPGAGKSSLARMIAADCAAVALNRRARPASLTRAYRVMFIELHRFDLRADVKEAVDVYGREACGLRADPFDHLDADPLLLIFDGLDELAIREGAGRQSVVELVRQVDHLVGRLNHGGLPRVRALLLGREVVVSALEDYCRQRQRLLHLLPYHIAEDDRREWAGDRALIGIDQRDDWWRGYGALTGEPCDAMPAELTRGRVAELTAEPLLNYLIAITRAEGKVDFADEKTSLSDVYGDLVGQVYRRTHDRRAGDPADATHALPVAREVSAGAFRRFLQAIAVAAWHGDGRVATERQIRERLDERFLGRIEALTAGAKDGISRLVAAFYFRPHRGDHGDAAFEFTHQSFAEYLLGQRILRLLERMRREHARHVEDPDYEDGWSAKRCLAEWALFFGPAAIEPNVFEFVHDGLRHLTRQHPERVGAYQVIIGDLISRVLRHDFPSDAMPRGAYLVDALTHSRNAGGALLIIASACGRITASRTPVEHPDAAAFGTWLRRLQQQRVRGSVPVIHRHLDWLPLGQLALSSVDLFGADLFGTDLQGVHLQGADLQGADLQGADLQGADLQGAHLQGAHLQGAGLFGADLFGADLRRAELEGADLRRADLRRADLQGAHLQGAHLRRADLFGAHLHRADLQGAGLEGADLRRADLRRADLFGADLQGADLRRADLQGADLRRADLFGVDLQGARLQGAWIDQGTRLPEGFDPAKAGMKLT